MIGFNIKKLRIYLPISVVLYILLAIALVTSKGTNRNEVICCILIPLFILIMGVIKLNLNKHLTSVIGIALLLLTPNYIIVKILQNTEIYYFQNWFINMGLIFAVMLFLLVVFLRSDIAVIVPAVICCVIFTANELVTAFRGTQISCADLWAVRTALAVSSEYRFFITYEMVFAIDFTVLIIVLSRVFLLDLKKHKLLLRLGFTIATTVCCSLLANVDKLTDENHITYDGFALSASNKNFGTLATFFYGTKGMFIKKPNGYSDNNIKELLESCGTQAGTDLNPNVVVIMNEAFCDYGSLLDVQPDTDPLPYWHSLTDNAIDGDLMVPVTGGGTSYTEFEFLSGIGGGIFNNTYNPFLMGIHDDTYSIACDFKRLGYKSIGIHPFWGICWNRNLVYPRLGFDTFISGEDFDNKSASDSTSGYIIDSTDLGDIDYVRNYASDKESYNKVIEQFENKASDEKLFVFNVTVQNHSGYEYFGDDFEYKVNSIKYNQYQPLNQYLSLLKYSDEAYEELIEYFKDYPEPTVVLMFGDHQPGFKYYEPEEGKNKYDTYYQYVTNYKLWANYPLPDDLEGGTTSAGLLSLKLKQAAGLPLNEWDCFRRRLSERFTGISLYGYAKPKNNMFEYNGELNSDDKKLLDKYKCLEYYLFFKQGLPE